MSRALMDTTQVMEVWDKPVQAPKAAAADEAGNAAGGAAEAEPAAASSSEPAASARKEKEPKKEGKQESIDEILAKMKGMPGTVAHRHRDFLGSPLPHAHRDRLGSPLPHLRRDRAHPCHTCPGTGLTHICAGTRWAHPSQHLHRDWAHPLRAPGLGLGSACRDGKHADVHGGRPQERHARHGQGLVQVQAEEEDARGAQEGNGHTRALLEYPKDYRVPLEYPKDYRVPLEYPKDYRVPL